MRRGHFVVSNDLLVQVLRLPVGTEITAVDSQSPITCKVWVVHPVLPVGELTVVYPRWRTQEPVVFEGWGIDDK